MINKHYKNWIWEWILNMSLLQLNKLLYYKSQIMRLITKRNEYYKKE
jgi:hypothetical protein